ncbi:hypothetical protein GC197_11670 [bacterium]|nr:hypothetical protein [bacterium]
MGDNSILPYVMFFGGMSLLIWLLLRRNWRSQAKAKKARGKDSYLVTNPRPHDQPWTMSGGPAELNKWQVEMLERTREFQATVDTKLLVLQRMLLKVEAVASQLSTEDQKQLEPVLRETREILEHGSPSFQSVSDLLCDEAKRAEIYTLVDQGYSHEEIAKRMELDPYAIEMIANLRES